MSNVTTVGALLLGAYILGSLPFGLWIGLARGVDIRREGSGNIGATNVWRVCGRVPGLSAFLLDVLKGFVPPVVAAHLGLAAQWQVAAALLAIVGHTYSIFLGFKGGKGIATGLGALLGIAPSVAIAALCVFVAIVAALRYVSLGSILAAAALPFLMPILHPGDRARMAFAVLAAGIAVYKHRFNVVRLSNGTEPRVKFWSKPSPTPTQQPPQPRPNV